MSDMNEADYQRRVIETAQVYGWRVAHFRAALNRAGKYSTPMQGDRGFPDLVLARNGVVILAELKTDTGKLGPGQREWLDALSSHGRLWRPRDWEDSVLTELAIRKAA